MAATAIVLMIAGLRPWNDGDDMQSTFFSLVAFTLAAGVITAIVEEFLRGANVVRTQTGKNLLSSARAADAAQYAPLRRIHHPLRHRGDVHRHRRRRVQPGARDGDELRRHALASGRTSWSARAIPRTPSRSTTPTTRVLDVYRTASTSRSLRRRSGPTSRAPTTSRHRPSSRCTRPPRPTSTPSSRATNPDSGTAHHQGLSESADRVDMDWRGDCGGWGPSLRWCRILSARRCGCAQEDSVPAAQLRWARRRVAKVPHA